MGCNLIWHFQDKTKIHIYEHMNIRNFLKEMPYTASSFQSNDAFYRLHFGMLQT